MTANSKRRTTAARPAPASNNRDGRNNKDNRGDRRRDGDAGSGGARRGRWLATHVLLVSRLALSQRKAQRSGQRTTSLRTARWQQERLLRSISASNTPSKAT